MHFTDILALLGLLLIAAGVGLIFPPAGLIVLGLESVLVGVGGREVGGRE